MTICDADAGVCELKEIPDNIDVEAAIPGNCEIKTVTTNNPDGTVTVKEVIVCEDDSKPQAATQTVTVCDSDEGVCEEKVLPGSLEIENAMPDHCQIEEIMVTNPDGTISYKEIVVCSEEDKAA